MLLKSERDEKYHKFIKKYCLPENSKYNPRPSLTNAEYINLRWEELLRDYAEVDQNAIKRYLRNKPYKSFYLKTYWWYIIRHKRLLMDGFTCTHIDCDGKCHKLEIHHDDNYLHKGEEIKFMDTLMTLCETCHHTKVHEHEEEKPKKKRKHRRRIKKRNDIIVLTKTVEQTNIDKFDSKIKSILSQKTTITSDPQKYVVTVETKTMTITEVRAAILDDLDTLLDALKVLNGH